MLTLSPDSPVVTDYLTEDGAIRLADRLDRYWQRRGYYTQRFWVVPVPDPIKTGRGRIVKIYCIRNNLVNGIPPRHKEVSN